MLNAFNVSVEQPKWRSFRLCSPHSGSHKYRSIDLPAPLVRVHFRSRSIPCLGPGCPLCPLPARPLALLPSVLVGENTLLLLSLPYKGQAAELRDTWEQGWQLAISRGTRVSRISEAVNSLHASVGTVSEADVQESLCRAWGLPSFSDYRDEAAWVKACFVAIQRRL
jgi:hypothetical protein